MIIKQREKLLTLATVLVIGLFAADKLVITPLSNAWKARAERIGLLTKQIASGQQLLGREKTIRDRWDFIRTNALSPNLSAAQNQVLKSVDRWAQDSRISFTSIKPQWKSSTEDYMTLECQADAFGSLQALARFLYEMEKAHPPMNPPSAKDRSSYPLPIKIEDVQIATRDSEGQQLSLGIRFTSLVLTNRLQ
jgi:hypothetical protein